MRCCRMQRLRSAAVVVVVVDAVMILCSCSYSASCTVIARRDRNGCPTAAQKLIIDLNEK